MADGTQLARKILPWDPDVAKSFKKRLTAAGDDDALKRIVKDAEKYGVDWSHMLSGMSK